MVGLPRGQEPPQITNLVATVRVRERIGDPSLLELRSSRITKQRPSCSLRSWRAVPGAGLNPPGGNFVRGSTPSRA